MLFCFLLRDDGESDGAFGVLEQSDGLLMSLAVEQSGVDSVNLIAWLESARLGGRTTLKHSLDEDGQVALRITATTDNAEAQTVRPALQNHSSECRIDESAGCC